MKYIEKKLPKDFTYMLTRKEIGEINNELNNCIATVHQEGTSYSETKMARNWATNLSVVRIESEVSESDLIFHMHLDGIRKSNFKDENSFRLSKLILTAELKEKIKNKKSDFENNQNKQETIFIRVEKGK